MKISLSAADQKRLGCAEWLEWNEELSTVEAEAIEEAGASPYDMGSLTTANPTTKALRLMVWLSLRRSGVDVELAGFDFNLFGLRFDRAPGKAPRARSASRTPAPSASSTPRSRRKP